jgi:polyribonucleotide nucleotidyltransferase
MEVKRYVAKVGEREVIIETGKLAGQAGGAVTVRSGDSVLLATATAAKEPREGIDFFPLSVEFEERLYAAGRIPGSFFRREGKPTEQAILQARLIDRSIRPLFPKDFRNEVQVIVTALSSDEENPLDILGMIGASAALTISDIPWEGPIGAVRVGYVNGQFVFNPTLSELEQSLLDIRLAGSEDAIIMVEAGAKEAPEELVLQALEAGHRAMQDLIRVQRQMREEVGKPKVAYEPVQIDEALAERVRAMATEPIKQVLLEKDDKHGRREALDALLESIVEQLTQELGEENLDLNTVKTTFDDIVKAEVRRAILEEQRRPDGRKPNELRPLYCEVGLLPRTHGSGLFVRGETQVLTIATLGTTAEEQKLDSLDSEETKRYIHHYNFPPFSVGEVRPLRGPGRREIGHGALAERALVPVLPSEEEFPYTIRLVSEVLSSNGSSSMASVCGSTLALMDAGVPIKRPVAGVAMGLITDGQRYVILTDIQGLEDHEGDMDFKVAGTREGITALQMDIKVKGISSQILAEALAQAREARLQILDVMAQTISAPRPELSPYAPRIIKLTIDPSKIGMLIGPGGKVVRKIQEDAKVEIQIEEDGTVYIAARADSNPDLAVQMVEQITEEIQVGKIYTGKVVRITDFGAFVEILPGQDGLVHISQLADYRVPRVEDVVKVGDEVMVMVTDIDSEGRVRLSRRAVMEGWTPEEARMHDKPPASNKGEGGRPRGESGRPPRSGGERGGGERSVPSGPRRRGR